MTLPFFALLLLLTIIATIYDLFLILISSIPTLCSTHASGMAGCFLWLTTTFIMSSIVGSAGTSGWNGGTYSDNTLPVIHIEVQIFKWYIYVYSYSRYLYIHQDYHFSSLTE